MTNQPANLPPKVGTPPSSLFPKSSFPPYLYYSPSGHPVTYLLVDLLSPWVTLLSWLAGLLAEPAFLLVTTTPPFSAGAMPMA